MTKGNLNVAIVQTKLFWEDPESNRENLEEKINTITEDIDMIVLPEMFTTGFTMFPVTIAETMNGKSISWIGYSGLGSNMII